MLRQQNQQQYRQKTYKFYDSICYLKTNNNLHNIIVSYYFNTDSRRMRRINLKEKEEEEIEENNMKCIQFHCQLFICEISQTSIIRNNMYVVMLLQRHIRPLVFLMWHSLCSKHIFFLFILYKYTTSCYWICKKLIYKCWNRVWMKTVHYPSLFAAITSEYEVKCVVLCWYCM